MVQSKGKKYKCYTPSCNAAFSSKTSLNNHQRSCGQNLSSVLTIRIKKHKIQAALKQKNCHVPTDATGPSNIPQDMQIDASCIDMDEMTTGEPLQPLEEVSSPFLHFHSYLFTQYSQKNHVDVARAQGDCPLGSKMYYPHHPHSQISQIYVRHAHNQTQSRYPCLKQILVVHHQ